MRVAGYWEPSPPPQVGWETSWGSSWPRVGASERRFRLSTGCPGAGTAVSGEVRGKYPARLGSRLGAGASPSRKTVLCGALGRRGGPASLSRAAGALGDWACHRRSRPGAGVQGGGLGRWRQWPERGYTSGRGGNAPRPFLRPSGLLPFRGVYGLPPRGPHCFGRGYKVNTSRDTFTCHVSILTELIFQ